MFKGRTILFPVLLLSLLALSISGCEKEYLPELIAAEEAIDAAKAEGAPDLCPDEYQNAELKLKQGKLLFEDKSYEKSKNAAVSAETLGKEALDCALLAKQPQSVLTTGLPEDLANFKHSVFFDFNDNALIKEQALKLGQAAGFLKKKQETYDFWVVVKVHADLPGSVDDNKQITYRRGRVLRFFLAQRGLRKDRIIIMPMGETLANKELILDSDKSGKKVKKLSNKKNPEYRRADIVVVAEKPK